MKRFLVFIIISVLSFMPMTSMAAASEYHSSLTPGLDSPAITWKVLDSPEVAFAMFGMGGKWIAQDNSTMAFIIASIADDIVGQLQLGNATVLANDSDIASDLVLGVLGTFTRFLPGLVIEVGEDNIESLNETAFAAAERKRGNYLNGSMESAFENITVNGKVYNCIVFDYKQDPLGFGEPQETYLAYDTVTGVLVKGETSYSFGTPYILSVELVSIGSTNTTLMIVGLATVVVVIILVIWTKKKTV